MTFIIRILLFCILSILVHGQDESDPTEAEENPSESMTPNPTGATEMTFEPQTTVDSVSTAVMDNCPPCPTTVCETPTCPSCSIAPESTTDCPPCSTIAPETMTSYTPCEEPMTTTCLPCETTTVQTTCPPCTTAAPSERTFTPAELCTQLKGNYTEVLCQYTCRRYKPYRIIFQGYKENGESCMVGGKIGTCQPGLSCKLPPFPSSWW